MYVRVLPAEQDAALSAGLHSGDNPAPQPLDLVPQGHFLVQQRHELALDLAQKRAHMLLVVSTPSKARQRKAGGLHLIGRQPLLLVLPGDRHGSLHPKSSICICPRGVPAEISRADVSRTISVGPARYTSRP